VVVEVVFEAGGTFGFPGAMGVDPPKGLACGSKPAPRIIDAICIIPRRVSGFDLLENLARKGSSKVKREREHHLTEPFALEYLTGLWTHSGILGI